MIIKHLELSVCFVEKVTMNYCHKVFDGILNAAQMLQIVVLR